MEKEKQIKEMASDIIKTFSTEYIYAQSEVMKNISDINVLISSLISKGYRKINENEVVISKEEYAELKQAKTLLEFREETIKLLEDANIKYAEALELKVNIKERKETAEKFATELTTFIGHLIPSEYSIMDIIIEIENKIYDLAKQYDVDLGEEQ